MIPSQNALRSMNEGSLLSANNSRFATPIKDMRNLESTLYPYNSEFKTKPISSSRSLFGNLEQKS